MGYMRALAAVGTIVASVGAGSAAAAPADLDKSFGTGGTRTLDIGGATETISGMAVQDNGRIVFVGKSAANDIAVTRLREDGSLDPSFGGDGSVNVGFGVGGEAPSGLAIQQDGKLVVYSLGE